MKRKNDYQPRAEKHLYSPKAYAAIEKTMKHFEKNELQPEEAMGALAMCAAIIIDFLAQASPTARGHEEEMAQDFGRSVSANLRLLRQTNAEPSGDA